MKAELSTSRYGRIVQAVGSATAARLLTSAVSLLSLPLAVRYLGAERYGVWVTITTTVVWVNLLDLGIANTLTNHISRAYALDDKASATRYFTNALVLTAGIVGIAGLAFAIAFPQIDWVRFLNVDTRVSSTELEADDCRGRCLNVAGIALQPGRQNSCGVSGTPPVQLRAGSGRCGEPGRTRVGNHPTGVHASIVRHVGRMPSIG